MCVCVCARKGGGLFACVFAAKSFQGLWNETLQKYRPSFSPPMRFFYHFSPPAAPLNLLFRLGAQSWLSGHTQFIQTLLFIDPSH